MNTSPEHWHFHTRRRVEFSDTDLGGIVHFSRFFVWMEIAEHEFLRSLSASVDLEIDGFRAGWPRLAVACQFRSPAHFEDVLDVDLAVARRGRTSMTYRLRFRLGDRLVAEGELSAACCLLDHPDGLQAVPIPAELAARIDASVAAANAAGGGRG